MKLKIIEIHPAEASGKLNSEWFVLENAGDAAFSTKHCTLSISRKNSKKRKYFISNGMITQDIAWAMTVYERAVEMELGQELVLFDDPFA